MKSPRDQDIVSLWGWGQGHLFHHEIISWWGWGLEDFVDFKTLGGGKEFCVLTSNYLFS